MSAPVLTAGLTRADAVAWAVDAYQHPGAFYVDTETTGLGAEAWPVSIAILDWRGAIQMAELIKPPIAIPAEATAVHGIGDADVADAETLEDLCPRIVAILSEADRLIAYNAPFDRAIVENGLARIGAAFERRPWQCAMRWFSVYQGARDFNRGVWPKLAAAAGYFGWEIDAHDALADAEAAFRVVEGMTTAQ